MSQTDPNYSQSFSTYGMGQMPSNPLDFQNIRGLPGDAYGSLPEGSYTSWNRFQNMAPAPMNTPRNPDAYPFYTHLSSNPNTDYFNKWTKPAPWDTNKDPQSIADFSTFNDYLNNLNMNDWVNHTAVMGSTDMWNPGPKPDIAPPGPPAPEYGSLLAQVPANPQDNSYWNVSTASMPAPKSAMLPQVGTDTSNGWNVEQAVPAAYSNMAQYAQPMGVTSADMFKAQEAGLNPLDNYNWGGNQTGVFQGEGGILDQMKSWFGGSQGGTSNFGNVMSGIGSGVQALQGIQSMINANKMLKMNKDAFNFQKDAWNKNYQNQMQNYNTRQENLHRARLSADPNAYESLDTYMAKHALK